MPTIATRAAGSARGYGFAGIKLNVVSQTFTSSTTWVAPAGVTNLTAVIGKGQDGASDGAANYALSFATINNSASGSGANSLPITWSAVANTTQTTVNRFNTLSYNPTFTAVDRDFTFYANNTFTWVDGGGIFPYYVVPGTWILVPLGGAPNPPSGNATYGSTGGYYAGGLYIAPGGPGANTTGFGFTFPGGGVSGSYPNQVGEGATPASYSNVAVTPGASYGLSIPDNGYITIQYLSA